MLESVLPILSLDLVWAILITFAGGLMLGYTGWGGAMVAMPLLTFLYGPVDALVITMFGAVLVTAHLFPAAARIADWRMMIPLLVSMALCVPLGSLMLFHLDPEVTRRIIGGVIVGFSALILVGWRYRGAPGPVPSAATGALSGLINGFVGLGGPPLVIYMLAADLSPAVQRANILVFMALTSVLILGALVVGNGVTLEASYRGVAAAPFQWAGGALGAWIFARAPAVLFRKFTLAALVVLGISVAAL